MQVVYLDSLFLLNLLADYLLCLSAARISGLVLRRRRYFAAALLGAAYAAAVFLPGCRFLASPLCRLGAGLLMGLLAFGREREPLRCIGVLLAVSAAFGGALWALSLASGGGGGPVPLSPTLLLLSFGVFYVLLQLLFRCGRLLGGRRLVAVRVSFLGREARFSALRDTGNTLQDPATGRKVLVACPHALRPILRENSALFAQLPAPELIEAAAAIPELKGRLRLLPYSNLSGSGLLPVFRPDRMVLDGDEVTDRLVAVSPNAAGEGFEGLL